jgi:hypothetical protein
MSRLDERIEFIYLKFSGKEIDRSSSWWSQFKAATEVVENWSALRPFALLEARVLPWDVR